MPLPVPLPLPLLLPLPLPLPLPLFLRMHSAGRTHSGASDKLNSFVVARGCRGS